MVMVEKPMKLVFREKIGAGAAVMALRGRLREFDANLDSRLPVREAAMAVASEAATLVSHASAYDLLMQMTGFYEDMEPESPEDVPGRHEEGAKETFVLVPTSLIQRLSTIAGDAARELATSADAGVEESLFDEEEAGETRGLANDLVDVVSEIAACENPGSYSSQIVGRR